jgi:signal transduction histidine kinase
MNPRPRRSVLRALLTSYVLFGAGLIASVIVAMYCMLMSMTGSATPEFEIHALVDDPDSEASRIARNAGIWTEGLDADFNVVEVRGDKLDEATSYTVEEILAFLDSRGLNSNPGGTRYQAFLRAAGGNGEVRYWLSKVARENLVTARMLLINGGMPALQPHLLLFYTVALVLCGICTAGLSLSLRKRISRPLAAVTDGLARIERGERDVRLDVKADREFTQILTSFDTMEAQLREEQALREAAEQRKNQLLLNLSHDIRTPLATIQAYSQALQEGVAGPEKTDSYLQTIAQKATRVADLSENLFTILSMDNQDYPLAKAPVDLAELVRQTCAEHYEQFQQAGLELTVTLPDDPVEVVADATLVRRAIDNLIGNALKYDKTGHQVEVSLDQAEGAVRISVSDDGSPIPPANQAAMFDAFTRGDAARTSADGSGLGLTITKAIVARHSGTLTYERREERNRFTIALPA